MISFHGVTLLQCRKKTCFILFSVLAVVPDSVTVVAAEALVVAAEVAMEVVVALGVVDQ